MLCKSQCSQVSEGALQEAIFSMNNLQILPAAAKPEILHQRTNFNECPNSFMHMTPVPQKRIRRLTWLSVALILMAMTVQRLLIEQNAT